MKNFLGFFFLLFTLACSSEEVAVNDVQNEVVLENTLNPSGSYSFFYGGQNRTYYYYQPSNLIENAPLLFVLHGFNSNVEDFMRMFPMQELADEHGFAVVYPQGLKENTGRTHWNAGLTLSNVDDVGFLSELAELLQETYQLNPDKTFTSGYSNGGFMSYELVVKRPDIFKAAASISGTMSLATWNSRFEADSVPILQLSGALDRIVPIHGLISNYGGWGGAPEISEIMAFWGELNQAVKQEVIEQDETTITKYVNQDSGDEVWYYLIENLDHGIPMGINYNVSAPSLIWDFFSNY